MPTAQNAARDLGIDPSVAARIVAAMGRGSDTMLAHINPREAAMLRRSGGTGKVNPKTGLREYDGGGDSPNFGGESYTGPIGGLTVGGQPAGSGILSAYTPAYPSSSPTDLPSGTLPISPSLLSSTQAWSNAQAGAGGGITDTFFDPATNPQGVAYPGNPYYTTDALGNAIFSPQGQQAYTAWQGQQSASLAQNAAGAQGGLSGFLASPLGALSILGFPLAVGGAVAGLGALGVGADTGVAATGDIGADLIDTTAAGSGGLGAVTPDIGGFGLAPADQATEAAAALSAPVAVSEAPVLSAGSSAVSLSPSSDLALQTQSALAGGGTNTVGELTTDAGTDAETDAGTAAGTAGGFNNGLDLVNPDGSVVVPPPDQPGILSQISQALGLSPGPTQSTIASIVNNPLVKLGGLGAAGFGLVRAVGQANASNPIPGMSNVQNIAQQSATQGAILQQYLTNGTLPPAVQASVDQATQSGIAAIKSRYAAMNVAPGSSQETQDIARLQQNAVVQGATLADQLTQQGISLTELSAQLYNNLVGYNTQLNTQTGQAITALATALAGSGNTIKLTT